MQRKNLNKKDAVIGYFTVVDDQHNGWTGGLLALDSGGRPVEFQCTLPVRPTRAHEILFGPTLRSHVISQVVGKLLVGKCRSSLLLLCCDQPEALAVESFTDATVTLVREAAEFDEGPITDDMLAGVRPIAFAGSELLVPVEQHSWMEQVAELFIDLPDAVEPFERIREAIKEAHSQLARQRGEAA